MQILTIRKGFEQFECKFYPLEPNLKHSNANFKPSSEIRSIWMQILTIRKGFEPFKCKLKPLEMVQSIRIQPFERDSKHSEANSNHSKGIEVSECIFELFERDSTHWKVNPNHSKVIRHIRIQIRSIRKQIWTVRTQFEAFECKFEYATCNWNYSNENSNHPKGIRSIQM